MNYSRRFSELFAVVAFVRNKSPQRGNGPYNEWISNTLGKIGAIQHNCYIPPQFQQVMSDPTVENFRAVVRVVQELSPGRNTGALLFHPICVIQKSDYRVFNQNAFTSALHNCTVLLSVEDKELSNSVLWGINAETKAKMLRQLQANAVIPDVSKCIRTMAASDAVIAHSLEKSDRLISYAATNA